MSGPGTILHVCGPEAEGSAQVGRRTYRWEYSRWWGPTFLRRDGKPLKRQPGEGHPVWALFEAWEDERKGKKGG